MAHGSWLAPTRHYSSKVTIRTMNGMWATSRAASPTITEWSPTSSKSTGKQNEERVVVADPVVHMDIARGISKEKS